MNFKTLFEKSLLTAKNLLNSPPPPLACETLNRLNACCDGIRQFGACCVVL